MSTFYIQKAAVLGAGVMGAQIAAHLVNAGIETYLYDLPAEKGPKNAQVFRAISQLSKLKPSPLAYAGSAQLIKAKNYHDDLSDLSSCDLVIEAIAERMDWKKDLFEKVAPHLNDSAIFATNTSGLSIESLSNCLPAAQRSRFCGVHFFNPPRYMHLCEVIPTTQTDPQLLNQLETFLVETLGKGVVRAKDTPNFIANRIGVFSMLATLYHANKFDLSFDEVDALTGPLLGRPKSATCRTMDVVGLDTMAHVVNTLKDTLTDCPWHDIYQLPDWFHTLIQGGALGQKTRCGIYKKVGKAIHVFDVKSQDYVLAKAKVDPEVREIFKDRTVENRFTSLAKASSKQGQFLYSLFNDLFHYCAHNLPSIAETVRDIDLAIRWGFGWQEGPFETWQKAGVQQITKGLASESEKSALLSKAELPMWLHSTTDFYKKGQAFSPVSESFESRSTLPVYQKQYCFGRVLDETSSKGETLFEDSAVRLWTLDNEVGILSFKSQLNAIGEDVLDGIGIALNKAESDCSSMVIWQDDPMNFSVGANLKQFSTLFDGSQSEKLHAVVSKFQQTVLRLKYSPIPVVAAVRGRALGGGCELLMHCDKVVAAFESYIGLVEIGVGLLPAGGGCKEFSIRAHQRAAGGDAFYFIEKAFKQLAMAEVSQSGLDAKKKGFLRESDQVVMNAHDVLFVAIEQAKTMARIAYRAPMPCLTPALGRESLARLKMIVVNMQQGGFISEHDAHIANSIATVLCGGELDPGTMVDEAWWLRLEIDAFVALASTTKTNQRVSHLLETGKPLRN